MADQLRERVRLARLKRLGLDDQVAIAGLFACLRQIDADVDHAAAEVRGRELVDDGRYVSRHVLCRLRVFDVLRRDQGLCYDSHSAVLSGHVASDEECLAAGTQNSRLPVRRDGAGTCRRRAAEAQGRACTLRQRQRAGRVVDDEEVIACREDA